MNFKNTLTISLILLINCLGFTFTSNSLIKYQQDTLQLKASDKASQLLKANKNEELLAFCKNEILKLLKAPVKDSIEIAALYKYQGKSQYQLQNYLECIKSTIKGIKFCSDTEEGRLLKGQLYSDKASAENYAGKDKGTFNSTLNAIKYLTSVKQPDYDYLITSYRYLSEQCAYHGNFDDAKRYLRQAEEIYTNHKKEVDLAVTRADSYRYKYDIILLYSKVYQLYKYGKAGLDSLEMVKSISKFEKLHKKSDFNVEHDGVYYTTALNHIGDWYASRKPEAKTTKLDLEKALFYIDKSIFLVENKGYKGNLATFKYNKVKALVLTHELEKAENLMSGLIAPLSETDGRKPFFLAQKALIKAKQKQKDSAVAIFYKAIEKVHSDTLKLAKDFKNFKPSLTYGHTKLLLRITEELQKYFPEDEDVNILVAKLYPMAFLQFENSYDQRKFNKTQKIYLYQIIQGVIKSKKLGYNKYISPTNILNRFENIQNLLAWQKFNKNRQISNYPELDSLQFRNYQLRSLIAEAKSERLINIQDSLNTLLSQTEKHTKEAFPNLNLFNTTNFRVEDLKKQLHENELVIKYILFNNQIAIYTITKDAVNVVLKPWSDTYKDKINHFVRQLNSQKFNIENAREIAQIILPKIEDDIEHIIINPDDVLSRFAFEVLSKNKKLLVEQYNISYTSSLRFIFPKIDKRLYSEELALYAPIYPQNELKGALRSKSGFLAGAQKESEHISQLFSSKLYNDKQLTKQDFIETASQYKLLHLAMHTKIDESQSGISRLLFSDESSNTDDLYLEELYGLNLSADLAVLSACNTGVDQSNSGTEIESFQRAFTFAGVPATVSSLWEVPDLATKEIIVDFYKNLKKGQLKSEALKNAKLNYKRVHANTKLAQPYYWAGFVIYGENKPIVNADIHIIYYGLITLVLVVVLFFLFYKKLMRFQPI